MKPIWLYFTRADLQIERQQLIDEGRELSELVESEFEKLNTPMMEEDPSYQTRLQALMDQSTALPVRSEYPYVEPSELEAIRAEAPGGPRKFRKKLSEADLADRMLGAWQGRCAGCLLGKPVEGWLSSQMWPFLKAQDRYPLHDYFRSDAPPALFDKYAISNRRSSFIDQVTHMPEDDDTNYTVTALAIMEQRGPDFTPDDVGEFWMQNIPILHTCTAERVAYRNLTNMVPAPASASYRNPYREWIGAQIRADFWGYAALGNPRLAAEFAWRDACISHVKNGIYGEMWVAAMLASAPFVKDMRTLIETGLSEIPAKSRLARDIAQVLDWHKQGLDYNHAVREIHKKWDEKLAHHWCHTNSNAQIVATGLLWGEDDFGTSICRAVQACFDTDCNGATVGSIFGMMHGAKALPAKWIDPLNDGLETGLAGYHEVKISDMAKKSVQLMQR